MASAFDHEHVLSLAFGTFEHAPTLDCVCIRCNRYFGNQLELRFARHSFEALLRYKQGIAESPGHRLLYVDITLPGPGPWEGVRLKLVAEDGVPVVTLVPQVAFPLKSGTGWLHVTEEEIDRGMLDLENREFSTDSVRIFVRSRMEQDVLQAKLAQRGITFKHLLPMPKPPAEEAGAEVEITFQVNRGIRRSIAKYAFNFLAFTCGPDFVLARDFDAARRFVRYGESTEHPLVRESFRPILGDDLPEQRQTDGHLLTVDWTAEGVIGQVSLFNHVTYIVTLAKNHHGLWRPIRNGIHFNPKTRSVEQVVGVSAALSL